MKGVSRRFVCGVALLFPLVALAVGVANQRVPYTLTLVAPKQPLKAGKALLLDVTITNASAQELNVPVTMGDPAAAKEDYRIHVLDEHGRPAPPWIPPPPPKGEIVTSVGMGHGRALQPRQSLTDEVNISHAYNLRRPGKYKVWILGFFYRGPNLPNGLIKSNAITVTVVK